MTVELLVRQIFVWNNNIVNRPFYQYSCHIELIKSKEYYRMPREGGGGHLLSIYVCFSGTKKTSLYNSLEKSDHYYIQTWYNDLFFRYNFFLGKLSQKACVNTEWIYEIVLMPPRHPIILLKRNWFYIAVPLGKNLYSNTISLITLHPFFSYFPVYLFCFWYILYISKEQTELNELRQTVLLKLLS